MFGLSLVSTKKLKHLYSEVSSIAIENVNLNKDVTRLHAELKATHTFAECLLLAYSQLDEDNRKLKHLLRKIPLKKKVSRK